MRILQLDVDDIEFELVKPEASVYEESKEKKIEVKNALVLLVSVENGDTEAQARQALADAEKFMKQQNRNRLVIYPFAHISSNLAEPAQAMRLLDFMYKNAPKEMEVTKAPFGWNKRLSIAIKGHPLAEQSKTYGESAGQEAKKAKPSKKRRVDLSIIKKSDWSGLPETDHRTIGERLDLFSFQEVSPGMTYWHPNGYIIYKELFKFIREKLDEYGYQEIATPAFANLALWHMSGHIDHYRDDMFLFESGGQEYGLKPMNCPSTILIFKSKKWSYRDFPIRFADFDKLYRSELSGVLSGLFRVREFTQDDAHIFVREDQIESEILAVIKMIDEFYTKFGLPYTAKLSTTPDSHLGDKALWDKATNALKNALKTAKMEFVTKDKEGAFYAPKIDFDIKDSIGREWQCATIQLDYQMPKMFGLTYTGEDGKQHMPAIIHRVIYGSLERFLAVLIEHLQGKFPTWLSPVQVKVLSISEQTNDYAERVYDELKKSKTRAEIDISDRTIEYKIREAINEKVPYIVVLGKREKESKKVTIRSRTGTQKQGIELKDFIEKIRDEISQRSNNTYF